MSSEFNLDIGKERENIVFISRQIEKFAKLIAVMTELGAEGPKKECLRGDNPTKGWLLQDALKKLWLWQPSKLEEEE